MDSFLSQFVLFLIGIPLTSWAWSFIINSLRGVVRNV